MHFNMHVKDAFIKCISNYVGFQFNFFPTFDSKFGLVLSSPFGFLSNYYYKCRNQIFQQKSTFLKKIKKQALNPLSKSICPKYR